MDLQVHHIEVTKQARYLTLGKVGDHLKHFWLVCHGYGQSVHRFISKFEDFNLTDTMVVAPEGLSRFYWKGVTGNPVASWMTKEDRLLEIEDYSAYLSKVLEHFMDQIPKGTTISLLGFSQGGTTVLRWINEYQPRFDNLILWASDIPSDINYHQHTAYWSTQKVSYVYGDQDEFITPARAKALQERVENLPFQVRVIQFKGDHRVDRAVLMKVEQKVRQFRDGSEE